MLLLFNFFYCSNRLTHIGGLFVQFIVNGEWQCSSNYPTVALDNGIVNNTFIPILMEWSGPVADPESVFIATELNDWQPQKIRPCANRNTHIFVTTVPKPGRYLFKVSRAINATRIKKILRATKVIEH
jgi:hypothetical protein